ncbi:MAG TPA: porin family protein [Candidatus Kryptonia bacterium]
MKRVLMQLVILFVIMIPAAFAQLPLSVGVLGGLNLANATTSPSLSTTTRTGMIVGGSIEFGLAPMLSVQPEVLYIQKGAKYSMIFLGQTIDATFKFDYVEVPILIKAKLPVGPLKPYVFVGPNIGFSVNAQGEVTAFGQTQTSKIDSTKSTDFCLDIGAGVEYSLIANLSLTGDVRYSLGLTNIGTESESWKSTGVQILVGVKISLM